MEKGQGWRRLKQIKNDDFFKVYYMNDCIFPLNNFHPGNITLVLLLLCRGCKGGHKAGEVGPSAGDGPTS